MSEISRRRFFVHSAHNTIGVSAGLAALEANRPTWRGAPAERRGDLLKVCLVSGSHGYESDESLSLLQVCLRELLGAKCSRAFRKAGGELPGLENLDDCDCMVLFAERMAIGGDPLKRIQHYCRNGGAVVGLRTASCAFQNWRGLDREVFGGDYQGRYPQGSRPQVEIAEAARRHPVLKGVEPFPATGSLIRHANVSPDATLLLTATIPGHTEPAAWTRLHRGGRVFYTSLGHRNDFGEIGFVRLLINAVLWTTRR